MGLSPRLKLAAFLVVSALSVMFLFKSLPLLLLWIFAVLVKFSPFALLESFLFDAYSGAAPVWWGDRYADLCAVCNNFGRLCDVLGVVAG